MQVDHESCAEVKYSTAWMLEHPEFFCASFMEFSAKCKARGWRITSRSQDGFLTLIGSAEENINS